MTDETFMKFLDEKFGEIISTRKLAHAEYASNSNVFHNFTEDAIDISITPEQSLYILMAKHHRTIARYIKGEQVEARESIEGRIKDNILYLFLLWGMVAERRRVQSPPTSISKQILNPPSDQFYSR